MILIKRPLALFLFMAIAFSTRAQNIGNSPYSRYGIGDMLNGGNVRNMGIGGAGIGSPDFRFINYQNPATLTINRVVSFEAGITYQYKRIQSETESQSTNGSIPTYGVLAFPITKIWTSSFGLQPSSVISFERNYSEVIEGDSASSLLVNEVGKGGLNQVFWGNGVKIADNFSVGTELSYLFGRREVESKFGIDEINPVEQNVLLQRQNFRGFGYKIGAFYKLNLDSAGRTALGIGMTFTGPTSFSSDDFVSRQTQIIGLSITEDTFAANRVSLQTPMSARLGFGLKRSNNWTISADFEYTPWVDFDAAHTSPKGRNVIAYRAGLEWIPNYRSVTSVFARSVFRLGFHYEPYAFEVNQTAFDEIGMNIGASIPIGKINFLSLGLGLGQRGTLENNLILENFARISFGLTINDPSWFRRYRHD